MNQELYDLIRDRLTERIDVSEEDMGILVHELTTLAVAGAEEHISELEEANSHLKETIKRLSRENQS